jgi:hypothetical protein
MRVFIFTLRCLTALLVDHANHVQIQWTSEEEQQPYREYDIDAIKIFGSKEFSKVYVNGYGTVSFDQSQLGIVDSQTFTDADLHKIILAPYWASVSNPVVKVGENGATNGDASAVNAWVQSNFGIVAFTATNIFTVTWVDQATAANAADLATFQLVIASDGYFTYAIFSYDNGIPTWAADEDGMTPISGLLAHHRRQDLCLKRQTTSGKDIKVGNEIGWNIFDHLDCTDAESFTECGEMKESDQGAGLDAMNLQYSYSLHYESTSASQYDVFNWKFYAMVSCNVGFQLDAAGNTEYKRECVYDPDFYETEWISPTDSQTGSALQCREMIIQNVQITISSVLIENFPSDYLWMLNIDPTGLSAVDQLIWQIIFQQIFISILAETYGIEISIHIISIVIATSSGRKRRNIGDILSILESEGLVDPGILSTIPDLEAYLTAQATDADAASSSQVVQNVDFDVGFEDTQTTAPTVEAAILEVLNQIEGTSVATLPQDIQV